MLVSELIELLNTFPQEAELGKVNLSDNTGMSDSEMTKNDWGLAVNIKDAQGNPSNKKLVFCSFGKFDHEEQLDISDEIESDCNCFNYIYSENGKRRWCEECGKEDIGF